MEKLELFKKIDDKIFDEIKKVDSNPEVNKLRDLYLAADEKTRQYFKYGSFALFYIVPIVIVFIMFQSNNELKENIKIKQDIIKTASEVIGKKIAIEQAASVLFSAIPIDSEKAFTSLINKASARLKIDTSKISVSNYESESIANIITKSSIMINIKGLGGKEVFQLMKELNQNLKMMITFIDLNKANGKEFVAGNFEVIHYTKEIQDEY